MSNARGSSTRRLALCLLAFLAISGCASYRTNDPWLERSAKQNEQAADMWRKAGEPSLATPYEQQAERDRQAAKKKELGFFEVILDSLIIGWIDSPSRSAGK
jgi:hypothetical protein